VTEHLISMMPLTRNSILIPIQKQGIFATSDCKETIITTKWGDSMVKSETGKK